MNIDIIIYTSYITKLHTSRKVLTMLSPCPVTMVEYYTGNTASHKYDIGVMFLDEHCHEYDYWESLVTLAHLAKYPLICC